jgi:hypothetical protein
MYVTHHCIIHYRYLQPLLLQVAVRLLPLCLFLALRTRVWCHDSTATTSTASFATTYARISVLALLLIHTMRCVLQRCNKQKGCQTDSIVDTNVRQSDSPHCSS